MKNKKIIVNVLITCLLLVLTSGCGLFKSFSPAKQKPATKNRVVKKQKQSKKVVKQNNRKAANVKKPPVKKATPPVKKKEKPKKVVVQKKTAPKPVKKIVKKETPKQIIKVIKSVVKKEVVKKKQPKKVVRAVKKPKPVTRKPVKKKPAATVINDGSKTHIVVIPLKKISGSSSFNPKKIRVKVGENIKWINEDTRTHFINTREQFKMFTSYDDEDDDEEDEDEAPKPKNIIRSPRIKKGDVWIHNFDKKGTYKYYCFIHPMEMNGEIIVE